MKKLFIIVRDGAVESVTGEFNSEEIDITVVDMDVVVNNIELEDDMKALENEALSHNMLF